MKKKNLLIALIGLTTISLAGVGFATWVVGVTQKDVDSNLQVEVDAALNDSVFLKAGFATNAKVAIAETAEVPGGTKSDIVKVLDKSGTSGASKGLPLNKNALKFSFNQLEYVIGNAVADADKPAYLKLELTDGKNDSNIVTADGIKLTDKKGDRPVAEAGEVAKTLHYLHFKQYVELNTDSYTVADSTEGSSKIYTLKDKNFELLWGDFFGNVDTKTANKQPSDFYNELYKGDSTATYDTLLDASTKAYQELSYMKSVLTASSNKFTITASLLTTNDYNTEKGISK